MVFTVLSAQDLKLIPVDFRGHHPLLGATVGNEEPAYHLQTTPTDPSVLNTKFYLYTSEDVYAEISYMNEQALMAFDLEEPFHTVYIVVHEYDEKDIQNVQDYVELKRRLFQDLTVFHKAVLFVDWSTGTSPSKQAASNTMIVGRELGLICHFLEFYGLVDETEIHMIGLGMGAQILHFAARWFTEIRRDNADQDIVGRDGPLSKIGRITALDPYAQDFQGYREDVRYVDPHINRWDALDVVVIHTASIVDTEKGKIPGVIKNVGMSTMCGQFDFYPNGGIVQPACIKPAKVLGIIPWGQKLDPECNHKISLRYFIASILSEEQKAMARYFYGYETQFFQWRNYDDDLLYYATAGAMLMGMNPDPHIAGGIVDHVYHMPLWVDEDYNVNPDKTEKIRYEEDEEFPTPTTTYQISKRKNIPGADSGEVFLDFPDEIPLEKTELDIDELPSCGQYRKPVNSSGRVVHGHLPYRGQFPFMVCLVQSSDGQDWQQSCTGTILDKHWIITAAHCFLASLEVPLALFEKQTPVYITFGATDCQKPETGNWRRVLFNVDEVHLHPEYSAEEAAQSFDLTLIRLVEPIDIPEVYDGGDVNSACWKSMASFGYEYSADAVYLPAYGIKGFTTFDDERLTWYKTRPHPDVDWNSLRGAMGMKSKTDRWPEGWFLVRNAEYGVLRASHSGDSGGPFFWYVSAVNDNNIPPNVAPYRAVIVGILSAAVDAEDIQVDDSNIELTPVVGVKLHMASVFQWMSSLIGRYRPRRMRKESPKFSSWSKPAFVANEDPISSSNSGSETE
ncbi:Inactive pancreatic lipase-related protein 1 [Halotydeus destructor]|nr:Inactive pancreatic lipase-related protein 1 [Halotydeus destructor]